MKTDTLNALFPEQTDTYGALLAQDAPKTIYFRGNTQLFKASKTAVFCSKKCPGALIIKAHDYFKAPSEPSQVYMGGFHSPVEKECLRLLLKNKHPVIIWLARGLENHRIPQDWKEALAEDRLLLLSALNGQMKRISKDAAAYRNRCVTAFSDQVMFIHAAERSQTKEIAIMSWGWQKELLTFAHPQNQALMQFGATPCTIQTP